MNINTKPSIKHQQTEFNHIHKNKLLALFLGKGCWIAFDPSILQMRGRLTEVRWLPQVRRLVSSSPPVRGTVLRAGHRRGLWLLDRKRGLYLS